jgi:hypothetical protein
MKMKMVMARARKARRKPSCLRDCNSCGLDAAFEYCCRLWRSLDIRLDDNERGNIGFQA